MNSKFTIPENAITIRPSKPSKVRKAARKELFDAIKALTGSRKSNHPCIGFRLKFL